VDGRSPNQLLASVSVADFELLRAHHQFVELKQKAVLVTTGEPLTQIYFSHDGIISLVVRLLNGNTIEAAMIGRYSVFGACRAQWRYSAERRDRSIAGERVDS
jgi:CRP-like cAMP-binding protein